MERELCPMKTALLLTTITVLSSLMVYLLISSVSMKAISLLVLCASTYLLGWLYANIAKRRPSHSFRRALAMYYLIFSRIAFFALFIIFFKSYVTFIANPYEIAVLIVVSIISLLLSYYLVYYGTVIGAERVLKKETN